jgi:hypothetical protein
MTHQIDACRLLAGLAKHGEMVEPFGSAATPRSEWSVTGQGHAQCVCALKTSTVASVFPRTCLGWRRPRARDSILFCANAKVPVPGDNGARAQAALQRREFGTNRKRQAKTAACEKSPHHACVLFVQHPPKNALAQGFPRGSFIACAGSFGNCVRATEGGIPKSSRVQVVSLTSLAFSGCVRRRDET